MANQPTSFRFPFDLPDDVHPGVKNALRVTYNGVKDLNDAIRALNTKVETNTTNITNVTQTVTGGGSTPSPAPTPTPAFGNVNLQPNLTPGLYTLAQSDLGGLILVQSGIAFALTLNSGLVTPFFTTVYNLGAGTITATPSLGNVNNGGSVTILTNQFSIIYFDGTNWWATSTVSAINLAPAQDLTSLIGLGNVTFPLTHTPAPPLSLILEYNGVYQRQGIGNDYTLSGNTITTLFTPVTGETLVAAFYTY